VSKHKTAAVEAAALRYIKSWIPAKGHACLAGNSVHADKGFLDLQMPNITGWLHYR
jgi:oligoribonuclease